ncbi:MAG: PIG-L family deacetylase [Candidatus Pacearchaeota archaeon]
MVLAPHPDDESLGCFGYLKRAKEQGSKIKVIILTDGFFSKT